MKKMLEELWYGNIMSGCEYRIESEESKELTKLLARHSNHLENTLTDEQKKIMEKYNDCYADLNDIREREIFIYAFRLGARIAIEVMS